MTAEQIEYIIMDSATERTKEFIVRCIGRHYNVPSKSVFETYEPPRTVAAIRAYLQIASI